MTQPTDPRHRKATALTHITTQHAAELGQDIAPTMATVRKLMQSGRADDTRRARELLQAMREEGGEK